MTRSINVVIGNHAGYKGIEDYVHFLNFTLTQLGYNVSESITARNDVIANIWIEEFGTFADPNLHSKPNSDRPLDLIVCTEYPSRYRTFNAFNLSDRVYSLIAYFFPVCFIVRNILFSTSRLATICAGIVATPLLIFGRLTGLTSREAFYRLELSARLVNLKKIANQVAGFVVISEGLKSCYESHFPSVPIHVLTPLLPDFPVISTPNTFSIFFLSGKITNTRNKWIRKALRTQNKILPINFLGRYAARGDKADINVHTDFTKLMASVFESGSMGLFLGSFPKNPPLPQEIDVDGQLPQYAVCEVYVGQTHSWSVASPMRDYRAMRNGHLSINAGHYKDGIFEDLVINAPKHPGDFVRYIQTLDINQYIESLPHRISSHNSRYLPLNRAIVEAMLSGERCLRLSSDKY